MFLKLRTALAAAVLYMPLLLQAAEQRTSDWVAQVETQVGIDAWSLRPSVEQDDGFWARGNSLLLLPNALTKHSFRSTSPWFRLMGNWSEGDPVTLGLRVRADQNMGLAVDQLAISVSHSPALGLSLGVLDYKTSWCGTYERDSPWVAEPNPFCNNRFVSGVVGGAPGVQTYTNLEIQGYRLHAIAGAYNPLLLGYNKTEFGNVENESANTHVVQNKKWGASVNLVSLETGAEYRVSRLQTRQAQTAPGIDGPAKQSATLWHLGWARNFGPATRLRYTFTHIQQDLRYQFDSRSYWLPIRRAAHSAEVIHHIGTRDTLSWGLTRTQDKWDDGKYFSYAYLRHDLAWRHDWGAGAYTSLHWLKAKQHHRYPFRNASTHSDGSAFGIRLGYNF